MALSFDANPDLRAQLQDVARTYGTPTYVYVESVIHERTARLRSLFEGLPVKLLYAMKANAAPAVMEVIRAEGIGLETVSPGELVLADRMGFPSSDVLFSANNMTDEEMTMAYERGVLLNIGELSRLDRFGQTHPGAEVCVRLNPQVGAGHHRHVITAGEHSKFGIPVEDADAIREVLLRHDLKLVGLHQHIGSGIMRTEDFARAIQVLLEAAPLFPEIRFLNFGGGLGVPYRPGESEFDLQAYRQAIVPMLTEFRTGDFADVEFWFEPGRYFVAESGVLLVETNTVKHANGRLFAGTNSGMGQLMRPSIYGAYHAIENLSNPKGPMQKYHVAGNICESGDLFAADRSIPEIREGDILGIMDAGAYGMSMASTYNLRPLPAEVFIDVNGSERLIRRRKSAEEMADELLGKG
jgi:diaminopimelate decarboxylase